MTNHWLIAIDEDGYYVRQVLKILSTPPNATYFTRVLPGTYATLELAAEAAAQRSGDEKRKRTDRNDGCK